MNVGYELNIDDEEEEAGPPSTFGVKVAFTDKDHRALKH